jgi:hypothetical protein
MSNPVTKIRRTTETRVKGAASPKWLNLVQG